MAKQDMRRLLPWLLALLLVLLLGGQGPGRRGRGRRRAPHPSPGSFWRPPRRRRRLWRRTAREGSIWPPE